MKTLEEAAKLSGITQKAEGLNLHFSPIPNWYGCILGFDCPICDNSIDWIWDWEGNIPQITTHAPRKSPKVYGAILIEYGHRYIGLTCDNCKTKLFADNFDE